MRAHTCNLPHSRMASNAPLLTAPPLLLPATASSTWAPRTSTRATTSSCLASCGRTHPGAWLAPARAPACPRCVSRLAVDCGPFHLTQSFSPPAHQDHHLQVPSQRNVQERPCGARQEGRCQGPSGATPLGAPAWPCAPPSRVVSRRPRPWLPYPALFLSSARVGPVQDPRVRHQGAPPCPVPHK